MSSDSICNYGRGSPALLRPIYLWFSTMHPVNTPIYDLLRSVTNKISCDQSTVSMSLGAT